MATAISSDIPTAVIPNVMPALPEIILAVSALILLAWGAIHGNRSTTSTTIGALIALAAAAFILFKHFVIDTTVITFGGLFIADPYSFIMKGIVVTGSIVALLLSLPYWKRNQQGKPEYPVLIVLATVGMFSMVSANDLLTLYVGLELQSFALYILASFQRENRFASEAGLKYFFLGALSSGILLYGMSLVYGYAGTTNYLTLSQSVQAAHAMQPGLIIGLVMVLSGMAFKIAAAPFHMWTPDVYQGAPTPVTAFFAMAPKAAAFGMIIRLLYGPFAGLSGQWQQVLMAMAFLSVIVGSFAGLRQTNVKRLMAYSSIGHVGFILLGLAAGTISGMQMALLYIMIYIVMSAGAFAVILSLYQDEEWKEDIQSLAGLAKTRPVLALSFAVILFSMAGIPPLAGFLAKLYVLKAAVEANMIALSVVAVLASVVSAYYYLRLVKIMYFDEPVYTFSEGRSRRYTVIAAVSAAMLVILTLMPSCLYDLAALAKLTLS